MGEHHPEALETSRQATDAHLREMDKPIASEPLYAYKDTKGFHSSNCRAVHGSNLGGLIALWAPSASSSPRPPRKSEAVARVQVSASLLVHGARTAVDLRVSRPIVPYLQDLHPDLHIPGVVT